MLAVLAFQAWPQAPSEERRVQGDTLAARQQRLSELRRRAVEAEDALKKAEQEAGAAKASFEQARKANAAATTSLNQARSRSSAAHKAYEAESAAFERARQGN
jgi:hypothetical protein